MDPPRQHSRASLPTPSSDGSESRGQKRKRVTIHADATEEVDEDERKFTEYYDPNQNADERRETNRKSRALEREYVGRRHNSAQQRRNAY